MTQYQLVSSRNSEDAIPGELESHCVEKVGRTDGVWQAPVTLTILPPPFVVVVAVIAVAPLMGPALISHYLTACRYHVM
jgi:hypothetical protein